MLEARLPVMPFWLSAIFERALRPMHNIMRLGPRILMRRDDGPAAPAITLASPPPSRQLKREAITV